MECCRAIRLADSAGNPATVGDPKWTPLAVTAPDPSYPGTHSTMSSAGATVLSAFFGNQDHIRVTSAVLPGTVRTFASYDYLLLSRLRQAICDVAILPTAAYST